MVSDAADSVTSPPKKRIKQAHSSAVDVLNESLFKLENIKSNREKFLLNANKPFSHNVLHDFCRPGFLNSVLEEIVHNSKVDFKESDLFKFYQSIDLANLGENENSSSECKLPNLQKLKDALYSQEFRRYVEQIADLPPNTLTAQVDCAANCHTQGCHLLCHDDVIGTRKVSYIIYLTDPSAEWSDSDGGRLELYESCKEDINHTSNEGHAVERKAPKPYPCKTLLPIFNTMAYFVVLPGESFHSVQEVFCEDRPRLSIQGWYHAQKLPKNIEHATLQRLKSIGKGEDTESPFQSFDRNTEDQKIIEQSDGELILSKTDLSYLEKYINKTYLKSDSMREIRKRFEEESSVQLRHFLNKEWEEKIKRLTSEKDKLDRVGKGNPSLKYNVGEDSGWKVTGPSHKQRFLEYSPCELMSSGSEKDEKTPGTAL